MLKHDESPGLFQVNRAPGGVLFRRRHQPAMNSLPCQDINTDRPLTNETLRRQTDAFKGTGGTSEESHRYGFVPAFLDTMTGRIYFARYADGRLAPVHLIDGLPRELVAERDATGRSTAIKPCVIAGFVRGYRFYTREEVAAEAMKYS